MLAEGKGLRKRLRICVGLLACALAGVAAALALTGNPSAAPLQPSGSDWFSLRAKVTRVVDGDTFVVKIGKRQDRVRVLGIDTPELGGCYASQATAQARRLAGGKFVRLAGDRSQARRDRFGRLLAYVKLPNGKDYGRQMLLDGYATVLIVGRPFARVQSYRNAVALAQLSANGMWSVCAGTATTTSTTFPTTTETTTVTTTVTTPTTTIAPPPTSTTTTTTAPPPSNCDPSYPDVCIPSPPPDLDCGEIPYRRFRVIYTVPNPDPHRFDRDHDGIGCESEVRARR
jgi:micrococcal nuclease